VNTSSSPDLEVLEINRGLVHLLWHLTLSAHRVESDLAGDVLVHDITKKLLSELHRSKFKQLIYDLLAEFSALSANDANVLMKKIVSLGTTVSEKDRKTTNYANLIVTTAKPDPKTVVVHVEDTRDVESSGFKLSHFQHSKGLYLKLIVQSTSHEKAQIFDDNKYPSTITAEIQTFFGLETFGSMNPEFDEIKLKASIKACIFDQESFTRTFSQIQMDSLKVVMSALLETSFINVQQSALLEIDDKALIFANDNLTSVITMDFVAVASDFVEMGKIDKYVKRMHTFRMAQKYQERINEATRIHWIIALTKPAAIIIFKNVGKYDKELEN